MQENLNELATKYARYFAMMLDIPCSVVDLKEKKVATDLGLDCVEVCKNCPNKNCLCYGQFSYGCREAYRWDGLYIYHCTQDMVLVAASITNEKGELEGGLVIGPMILDNKDELLATADDKNYIKALMNVPEIPPLKIQSMAEILAGITDNFNHILPGKAGKYFYRQESLLNALYEERMRAVSEADFYTYPIAMERKLREAIAARDKEGSKILLNQILASIYISNDENIEAIKPRIMELIIVISRAAVDAGANVNEIFLVNDNFSSNIDGFTNIEDLSVWTSTILQRFLSFTFDFENVKHADAVYSVIEYIKGNYQKKISLEEIADYTYLSKTYLSSLFKKETGRSISEYINIVRVEKSKPLLIENNLSIIEVANMCGFEDQSYFTKVFKGIAGITPKKYRESRGIL